MMIKTPISTVNDFTVNFAGAAQGTVIASVGSPQPQAYRATGVDYLTVTTDRIVKATTAGITITLYTAVGNSGRELALDFFDLSCEVGGNALRLEPPLGDLIDRWPEKEGAQYLHRGIAGRSFERKFELANRGTLFLDEIGDLPLTLQAKILRALEEKQFERVGGTQLLTVDVRVVAATNRNLDEMVAEGKFREDLYYRLNVIQISVPPLRHRGDDVLLLLRYYLMPDQAVPVVMEVVMEKLLHLLLAAQLHIPIPGTAEKQHQ